MRRKAHRSDKKKQSLTNRGCILFSLSTHNLGRRVGDGSSHVILRTDIIHIWKAKGLLQLILLYSIRKQIFVTTPNFHMYSKTWENLQYPDCQSQYVTTITIQVTFTLFLTFSYINLLTPLLYLICKETCKVLIKNNHIFPARCICM